MNPILRLLCLTSVVVVCHSSIVLAQDDEQTKVPERRKVQVDPTIGSREVLSIGMHLGLGIVDHAATFTGLPGIPTCCPEFNGGSGIGVVAGLEAALPLSEQFRLMARVSFQGVSGTFETLEPTTIRMGNQAVETAFRHTFDASLSMIAIEPILEWRVTSGLGLLAGARVGFMSGGTFKQSEELGDKTIPYVFLNGRDVYLESNGNLENMESLQIGIIAGARYHVVIGGNFSIVPEVSYAPNFTDLRSDFKWSIASLRFGATMMLTIRAKDVIATPLRPQ